MATNFRRLGAVDLSTGAATTVYTLPSVATEAQFKVVITNYSAGAVTFNLWIQPSGALTTQDKIATGTSIPANGTLEYTGYALSGVDGLGRIQVQAGTAGTLNVSVHGFTRSI